MLKEAEDYFSVNIINTDDVEAGCKKFSQKFLQSVNLLRLLLSFLKLKIDMSVMLLHNLQLSEELCNEI